MRVTSAFVGLDIAVDEALGDIAAAATSAMRETMIEARDELRQQIVSNGLGSRLANTWTAREYPIGEKNSINPAGFIWSRAPNIVDSFLRGATIRPINGSKFLWIPTGNVPLAPARMGRVARQANGRMGARGLKGGSITPEECENRFNTDFIIRPGRGGHLLAFMHLIRSRNGRGVRSDTSGRRRQGRAAAPTLMFVLVPTTRMPKLLDIEVVVRRWEARYATAFTQRIEAR